MEPCFPKEELFITKFLNESWNFIFQRSFFFMNSLNEKKEDKDENLFFKGFVYRVE
jgi:hypothetical protein